MVLIQALRRQFASGSTRLGLRSWEGAANPWNAAQTCKSQQRAYIHRLFAQRTTKVNPRQKSFFQGSRHARWNSSRPNPDPTKHLGSPQPQTFYQRFKQLGKEYGWVVTGVYLGLSALDLPFCFLAVRWLGTERVGRWEHAIVGTIKNAIESVVPGVIQKTEEVAVEAGSAAERKGAGWGVEEADAINKSEEACMFLDPVTCCVNFANGFARKALWTQFVLAYAIHKSFIFIRVPLAVGVTPKVVKTLRSWGWNIGKRKPNPIQVNNTPKP